MPKSKTRKNTKVYAVRYRPDAQCKIFETHAEFNAAMRHLSGASGKGFPTRAAAEIWIAAAESQDSQIPLSPPGPSSCTSMLPPAPLRRTMYTDSANTWTEYNSPLLMRKQPYFVDSVGDRKYAVSPISGMSTRETSVQRPYVEEVAQCGSPEYIPLVEPKPQPMKDPAPREPVLSQEQLHVLDLIKKGENIFFTGPAGTGKSVLLRTIIKSFRSIHHDIVAVTAPTGIAALNIGGSTVHSFAGIGLGKESKEVLADRIAHSRTLRSRWCGISALIIDEISMLDGQLFDKLEYIARVTRDNNKPFGGIQLILAGDFLQLPPVPDDGMPATYAFEARTWSQCVGSPVILGQVFRQTDSEFIELLSAIRIGKISDRHISKLQQLAQPRAYSDGIPASKLFPLRSQVEGYNNGELKRLQGPCITYNAMDRRGYDHLGRLLHENEAKRLLDRLVAQPTISLKEGAVVMLLRNISHQLVNGSVGKLVGFLTVREAIEQKITIAEAEKAANHASYKEGMQGARDPLVRDRDIAQGVTESGESTGITAHLAEQIEGGSPRDSMVALDRSQFKRDERWPLVEFHTAGLLLCPPMTFDIQDFMGNTSASRLQVPLLLAWALSVHKSQGQTLSRVKVDLGRTFEHGQAYVALSRATTLTALEVTNFHPSKIKADPRVLAWYRQWASAQLTGSCDHEMDSEIAIATYHEDTVSSI